MRMSTASQVTTPNQHVEAANEVTYRYRRFGTPNESGLPLVLLVHFRANLDNWDPLLVDKLAAEREVSLVDLAGVGGSHRHHPEHHRGDGPRRPAGYPLRPAWFLPRRLHRPVDRAAPSLGGSSPRRGRYRLEGGRDMHMNTDGPIRDTAFSEAPTA